MNNTDNIQRFFLSTPGDALQHLMEIAPFKDGFVVFVDHMNHPSAQGLGFKVFNLFEIACMKNRLRAMGTVITEPVETKDKEKKHEIQASHV